MASSSSASTVLVAAFAALLVLTLGVPHAMGARSLGVVEWPCCRQYDAPPTVAAADVEYVPLPGSGELPDPRQPGHGFPAPGLGQPIVVPTPGFGTDETVSETAVDNAEPEWPCCRQYDAPPTVTADAQPELH